MLPVRFPKHPMLRKLLKSLNYPLAAPSANISTRLSSVKASDVLEEFGSKIKYVLDGGKCSVGVESTIINLLNKPTILRLGGLDVSKIKKVLKKKIFNRNKFKKENCTWSIPFTLFSRYSIKNQCKKTKKK